MVATEAVQAAKKCILNLYKDEPIVDVGLEELEFADKAHGVWEVTIGFSRRWQRGGVADAVFGPSAHRTYKTVRIRDDGTFISLKHRDVSIRT